MNLRLLSSRATVAAASTALAAGALVGLGSTAAQAATVTNTYTCTNTAIAFTGDFPLTVNGGFPAQVWSGMAVPGGTVGGEASAVVPQEARGLLALAQIDGARSGDFAFDLGDSSVVAPAEGTFSEDYSTWSGAATNAAFVTPAPGTVTVSMPEAFTFTTVKDGEDSVELDCALAEGQEAASLGETTFLKQTGTKLTAKAPKAKKGKTAKVRVAVVTDAGPTTVSVGKVVAKKGKKVVAKANVKSGKAVLKIKKGLKVGKNKLTVTYAANPSVDGAKTNVVVKVAR